MGVWILCRNHMISSRYSHCFLFWETRRLNLVCFKNRLWVPFHNDRTASFCFSLKARGDLSDQRTCLLQSFSGSLMHPWITLLWLSFQTALHPVARSNKTRGIMNQHLPGLSLILWGQRSRSWDFPGSSVGKTHSPVQRVWVQALVEELRSYMSRSTTKIKKFKKNKGAISPRKREVLLQRINHPRVWFKTFLLAKTFINKSGLKTY